MKKITFTSGEFLDIKQKFMSKLVEVTTLSGIDAGLYDGSVGVSVEEALFNINNFRICERSAYFEKVFSRYLQIVLKTKDVFQVEEFNPPSVSFSAVNLK